MNDKELALIFKGLSHILDNQAEIMKHLGIENFYKINDSNDLSVQYGKLAECYFKTGTLKE